MKQLQLFDMIPDRSNIEEYAKYWAKKQWDTCILEGTPRSTPMEETIRHVTDFLISNPYDNVYMEDGLLYSCPGSMSGRRE